MLSVVALVAWAIIGLPIYYSGSDVQQYWLTKDAAGFFTLLLVIIGVAQIGVFVWQLLLIHESVSDAKAAAEAARDAAQAAKLQAETAETQARTAQSTLQTMQDTARRQLRAYVHLNSAAIPGDRLPDTMGAYGAIPGKIHTFRLTVTLENSGQTPTRHALIAMNYEAMVQRIPDDFKFSDPPSERIEHANIGPSAKFLTPVIDVPADDVAQALMGSKYLYAWGWIEYSDVFPNSPRHRTEFCFQIVPDKGPPSADTSLRFVNHTKFNGADEDCLHEPKAYGERILQDMPL